MRFRSVVFLYKLLILETMEYRLKALAIVQLISFIGHMWIYKPEPESKKRMAHIIYVISVSATCVWSLSIGIFIANSIFGIPKEKLKTFM